MEQNATDDDDDDDDDEDECEVSSSAPQRKQQDRPAAKKTRIQLRISKIRQHT